MERISKQFQTPEEEIAFLRGQIAEKERELLARAPEADTQELESIAKHQLFEYGTFTPNTVLAKERQMPPEEVAAEAALVYFA